VLAIDLHQEGLYCFVARKELVLSTVNVLLRPSKLTNNLKLIQLFIGTNDSLFTDCCGRFKEMLIFRNKKAPT